MFLESAYQTILVVTFLVVLIIKANRQPHTTQRVHDVYTTSYQQRYNVLTLHRRWCDVVLILRDRWEGRWGGGGGLSLIAVKSLHISDILCVSRKELDQICVVTVFTLLILELKEKSILLPVDMCWKHKMGEKHWRHDQSHIKRHLIWFYTVCFRCLFQYSR